MAGEDDDLIVKIEDEEGDGGEQVVLVDQTGLTEGTHGKATVRKELPDDPVETLKAQLAEKAAEVEQATQRATRAETLASQSQQRTTQAEREAAAARTEATQSTRGTIDAGIAAAKAEKDAAGEAFEAAFDAGDKKALRAAQERIAQAAADFAMLQQAKADMGEEPAPRRTTERPAATEAPQNADPIEAFINSRTPRTQSWLREHRNYLTDDTKNAEMNEAHYAALVKKLPLDSDAYFNFVEEKLGLKKAPNGGDPAPQQRRPTAPAAPVSRTPGGLNGGTREVKLSRSEADAATDGTLVWNYDDPSGKNQFKKGDVIGIQEMARRKSAMTAEGRYHNVNLDGT